MTPREKDLLDFIKKFTADEEGVMPSYEEMANGIGLRARSGIHRLLRGLQDKGHITKLPHRARAIQLNRNHQIWIDGEFICTTNLSLKDFCEKTGCSARGAESRT